VVSSTIDVQGLGGRIVDVEVVTSITHTWSSDLDITLRSPDGTVVTLTTDNGLGYDNVFNGTHWNDRANASSGQLPYVTNAGVASDHPYADLVLASPLSPEEPLAEFANLVPEGTWTLTISDDTAPDGGSLDGWSLVIRTLPSVFVVDPLFSNLTPSVIPSGPAVISSTIEFPAGGRPTYIGSVRVTTNITHTSAADLDITLTSPAGTVVTLTTDNGGSNDNVFAGTVWDDTADFLGQVPYTSNEGLATDHPYANLTLASPLAPEEPLSAFVGEAAAGTWTLTISDDQAGESGLLTSWDLGLRIFWECRSKGGLDFDRADDLILRNVTTNQHVMWFMNGVVRASSATLTPAPAPTQQVVGADEFFPLVGQSDLVLHDGVTGQVEFWPMDGATRVGAAVPLAGAAPLGLDWKLVATGDFNHDGQADLVWRNLTTQDLVIWTLGEGTAPATQRTGSIVPNPPKAVNANWEVVAALDFDHDNNRDLLWYNANSGKIVMWFMDPNVVRISGTFTSPDSAGNANWRVVAASDYGPPAEGDALPDIVWRNVTSGRLVVWHMDGGTSPPTRISGGFTSPDSPTNPLDWTVVGPR